MSIKFVICCTVAIIAGGVGLGLYIVQLNDRASEVEPISAVPDEQSLVVILRLTCKETDPDNVEGCMRSLRRQLK